MIYLRTSLLKKNLTKNTIFEHVFILFFRNSGDFSSLLKILTLPALHAKTMPARPQSCPQSAAALKADRESVLTAVKNHGMALQYAAAELRDDREVVFNAVLNDKGAIGWASWRLLVEDKEGIWREVEVMRRTQELEAENEKLKA